MRRRLSSSVHRANDDDAAALRARALDGVDDAAGEPAGAGAGVDVRACEVLLAVGAGVCAAAAEVEATGGVAAVGGAERGVSRGPGRQARAGSALVWSRLVSTLRLFAA